MPEITVRGKRLCYEAQPEQFDPAGLSAVFIHGTGGDHDDWRYQLDGLSTMATIVALDLPGHGASDPPGESSVEAFSAWVTDFVAALGLRQVMLVGCSLGSAVTLWIALQGKRWLKAIGLVGSGARLKVHPAFLEGVLQDKDKAQAALAEFALASNPDPAVLEMVKEKMLKNSAEIINGDLKACNEFDVMNRLGEISVPTVIIVGRDDRLTPVKYSEFLHSGIPRSQLHVIEGAGHLNNVEKPSEFNLILGNFLEGLLS